MSLYEERGKRPMIKVGIEPYVDVVNRGFTFVPLFDIYFLLKFGWSGFSSAV